MKSKLQDHSAEDQATVKSTQPEQGDPSIGEAFKRAAKDADELNENIKGVFALPDSSATLRLRLGRSLR